MKDNAENSGFYVSGKNEIENVRNNIDQPQKEFLGK